MTTFMMHMMMQEKLRNAGHSLYGHEGLRTSGGLRGGGGLKHGANDGLKGVTKEAVEEQADKALSIANSDTLTTGKIEAPTHLSAEESKEEI